MSGHRSVNCFALAILIVVISIVILVLGFLPPFLKFGRVGVPDEYRIMGRGKATEKMMCDYIFQYNQEIHPQKLRYIVKTYIWESRYEGVNHDVAFVQMCHETNFLRFGDIFTQDQNNFCSLTTLNYDIAGACFFSVKDGIRAHIQHLKAYGSRERLNNQCIDPRFDLIQRGVGHSVKDLSGKWSLPGKERDYGKALYRKLNMLFNVNKAVEI